VLVSSKPDRSSAVALAGTTRSSSVYVFVSPQTGIARVRFFLDDPQATRPARQTEGAAPYDFAGTAADGSALPFVTGDRKSVV